LSLSSGDLARLRQLTLSPPASRVEALSAYRDLRDTSSLDAVDAAHLRRAILYGSSVEVHSYSGQPVVTAYDPQDWSFLEDENGEMKLAVYRTELPARRWYRGKLTEAPTVLWRVYDDSSIYDFEGDEIEPVGPPRQHLYGRPPVVLFAINEGRKSHITDALIGQQDDYNDVRSANLDDVDYSTDAFLLLQGYSVAEMSELDENGESQIDKIRRYRMITVDEGGDARYIEKGNSVEKVNHDLLLTRDALHMMGGAPDLHQIVGASGQVSGIALKLKFAIQCQTAEGFIKFFEQGIRSRIDLWNIVRAFEHRPKLVDYDVVFTRNVPVHEEEIVQGIPFLNMVLSKLDILRQLPSVEDPEAAAQHKALEVETDARLGLKAPEMDIAALMGRQQNSD
jgi:SPP1 family phage portal protein